MDKYISELNLTQLKELVKTYWTNPALKEKMFRQYEKDGVKQTILISEVAISKTPRKSKKGNGEAITTTDKTKTLYDSGVLQVSHKDGEQWVNNNFGYLKKWVEESQVETTQPQGSEDEINPDDIPF
jgi:hypothetical protein